MKQRQKNIFFNTSYKRLDKEKEKESDSGEEETELFVRNKPKIREIPTVEKDLEEGDTLQSLAIRFHCTISQLKRLNNIDKENEIFAKRTIKVPYRPFTMALAGVHSNGRTSPESNKELKEPPTSNLIDIDEVNIKLNNGTKTELNDIIFHSQLIQKECERVVESQNEYENVTEEEVKLLPGETRNSNETDAVVSSLNCSGADCDISWIGLIVFIVILIFAVPLIYVFYIAEHLEKYQHHGS